MIKIRSILSAKNYVLPIEFILMNVSVIYNTHIHELAYQLDNFKSHLNLKTNNVKSCTCIMYVLFAVFNFYQLLCLHLMRLL